MLKALGPLAIAGAGLVGCAGTVPPVGQQGTRATLIIEGRVRPVLADALGRRDSLDPFGDSASHIPGCRRTVHTDPTAPNDPTATDVTTFFFDREPEWPLELRWQNSGDGTVYILASRMGRDGNCSGETYCPDPRMLVQRWRIRPVAHENQLCTFAFEAVGSEP